MTITQGTDQWLQARVGRVTGSRIAKLMGISPWASRAEEIAVMVEERITGKFSKTEPTEPMEYGLRNEHLAAAEYAAAAFQRVQDGGFSEHPENPRYAASPDGLIGDDGIVEYKCPYKFRAGAPAVWPTCKEQPQYYAQVQWYLFVLDRKWADFFQWAPEGEPHLERVERDEEFISKMVQAAEEALAEVEARALGEWVDEEAPLARYDAALARIKELKAKIKQAEGDRDAALAELAAAHPEGIEWTDGRKLQKSVRKGRVSWAKAFKGLYPDTPKAALEKYTGDDVEFWEITE